MTDTTQQVPRSVNSLHADIPFRIRIGVTGHRQLPSEEILQKRHYKSWIFKPGKYQYE